MTLIRWNGGRDLPLFPGDVLSMQREINRMFEGFFHESTQDDGDLFPSAWMPAADLVERANEFVVKMELPGVAREDVKITVQDAVITVRGEKKQEQELNETNLHRIERTSGSFRRSFTLPADVQNDRVDAVFKDGILTVTLPKAEEAKPRQIEVKVK